MKRFALIAMMACGLIGCVKAPIEARQDPYVDSQVNIASEDLRTHTAVSAPRVVRDEAGLLHVTLPIRATTNLELYVDYRATFFDATGQTVNQLGWQTKILHPNIFEEINVVSTTPRAADFRIDLRYAK
jgi:uncharacterized protein YcfL